MVEKSILEKILFIKGLPQEMVEAIAAIAEIQEFEEEAVLFEQGQPVEKIYMLLNGTIFMNCKSPDGKVLTLDEVLPGRSFGISALIDEVTSTFTAICGVKSQVITVSCDKITELFKADRKLGYTVMLRVVQAFKSRMDIHTRQFLYSLKTHPDIRQLNG